MRLFAALPLTAAAMERLTSMRLRLSSPRDGLRWSPPEQWHITLQFYGEVAETTLGCLRAALGRLQSPAPEIALDGLGLFAGKGILYASVDPTPSLLHLQTQVVEASATCGIVPESRVFHPHITLARSRGKVGHQTLRRMGQPGLPAFGAALRWHAQEVLLLQSHLNPEGSVYTERDRFALTPVPASGVR